MSAGRRVELSVTNETGDVETEEMGFLDVGDGSSTGKLLIGGGDPVGS